jgi:serine/threonine protein kinase
MSWLSDRALERLRAAASAPDLSGTRYRLVREIGRGGMSSVFLVEDPALARRVALKVLDVPDTTGELAARLEREAQVLARLEHPGIAPIHEVGKLTDGRVYYTMRFVEGPRLDDYARGEVTLVERLRLFQRILDAVAFAHDRGVLHRDLKPENVMVGPFGEVLVMDWGLAKLLDAAEVDRGPGGGGREGTGHGAVLGTPGYMAPEQARGEIASLDARTDVYALGAVLDHVLRAGGAPPRGPLAAICRKAMAESPGERYPNVLELEADVARHLDGRRVLAYPEPLAQRALRLYARHRTAFWLVVAYLVVRGSVLFFTGR